MSFGGKKLIDKLRYQRILNSLEYVLMNHWHKHFNELLNKLLVNKRLLAITKLHLSKKAKLIFYYAYIFSHISYKILVWSNMIGKTYLDKYIKYKRNV